MTTEERIFWGTIIFIMILVWFVLSSAFQMGRAFGYWEATHRIEAR